jgi:hypothetical protein
MAGDEQAATCCSQYRSRGAARSQAEIALLGMRVQWRVPCVRECIARAADARIRLSRRYRYSCVRWTRAAPRALAVIRNTQASAPPQRLSLTRSRLTNARTRRRHSWRGWSILATPTFAFSSSILSCEQRCSRVVSLTGVRQERVLPCAGTGGHSRGCHAPDAPQGRLDTRAERRLPLEQAAR